jgi:hypothetical protein
VVRSDNQAGRDEDRPWNRSVHGHRRSFDLRLHDCWMRRRGLMCHLELDLVQLRSATLAVRMGWAGVGSLIYVSGNSVVSHLTMRS